MLKDPDARHIRVAAYANAAYSRDHFIKGLVEYGEIMKREEVSDRWRQHLLYTLDWTGIATRLFQRFLDLGAAVDEDAAADLLDLTLTLPVHLIVQSVDVRGVFGLLRGRFDYEDAGIPEAEVEPWRTAGFPAGAPPTGAPPAWIRPSRWTGSRREFPTPGRPTFAWRGIDIETAGRWHAAGIDGRVASRWIAQGVQEPDQIPRQA